MKNDKLWQEELAILEAIIQKTELIPATKWNATIYMLNGKNVLSFGGFKDYFALWFHNGVFLKDKYNVLLNAQEGKTKALRQWRFSSKSELNEKRITEYIKEAIQNEKDDKSWKPEKSEMPAIPTALDVAFKKDKHFKTAFEALTNYKQKEYIEYIDTAKKEETKQMRLEKIIPLILNGKGLNDKYK